MEIHGKRKLPVVLLAIILAGAVVDAAPRKKLVKNVTPNQNRRSQMLSSTLLTDYWKERGFHDSFADHLIASESDPIGKDLMVTGDEVEDFRGSSKIRIPRGRLTPPGKLPQMVSLTASISIPRKTKRLHAHAKRRQDRRPLTKAAQRRQDMEILESVTLVDGGVPTNMADGSLQIVQQASKTHSQRKFRQEDDLSPVAYAEDEAYLNRQERQQQPQQQQPIAEPSIQASFHALPPPSYYQNQYPGMGKPSNAYKEEPKSLSQLTQEQFEREVYHNQQQQPHQPHSTYGQHLPSPTASPSPKVIPLYLIPKHNQPPQQQQQQQQSPYQHPLSPPLAPSPQPHHQQYQPSPTPSQHQHQPQPQPQSYLQAQPQPHPSQQPHEIPFNTQLFQQQFQHPFAPQSNQPSPLAQVTASILSAASGVASAAATALAAANANNAEIPSPSSSHQFQAQPRHPYVPASAFPPTSLPQLAGSMLSAAASIQQPEVLLPTTTPIPSTFAPRPGVIIDDTQVAPISNNQLVEPENLAQQLTTIYETGKKILYFPKGVIDTVDTFLKQMERNPMVAYWGDKFFAKVFGDTSGT